jgi:sortase A
MSVGPRWLPWALLALGLTCLVWCGLVILDARLFQSEQHAMLERVKAGPTPSDTWGRPLAPPKNAVPRGLIGELRIPRLKLSALVVEGDDDGTLQLAVGHLPDTPLPWQPGNSALAGHRDTFFRPLKDVRVGDDIRLATPYGDLRYRVKRTLVVEPDDLSVLEPSSTQRLTLITCFPFFYVGDAPLRFIVQAQPIARGLSS